MDVLLPADAALQPLWHALLGKASQPGGGNVMLEGCALHNPLGARAPGIVLTGMGTLEVQQWSLSSKQQRILDHYFRCFDMRAEVASVDGRHLIYVASTPSGPQRSITEFDIRAKILAAQEITERIDAGPIPILPLLNRAEARVRGESASTKSVLGLMQRESVELVSHEHAYRGFFGYDVITMQPKRFDGGAPKPFTREVFNGIDAAFVLPYDPRRDEVLFVEQLRPGPFLRHDRMPFVLEPVAGLVDDGETPAEAAMREAHEEAGLQISELIPLYKGYPSPGASSEYFHCFLGITSLDGADGRIGGMAGEAEDIRSHVVSFEKAMNMVEDGEISVIPLMLLLLALDRKRAELRANFI